MSRVLLGSITSYYAWRGALPYLNFNGSGNYVNLGDTFKYTTEDFYVEFRIDKPTQLGFIVSKQSNTDNKRQWSVYYDSATDKLNFVGSSDGTNTFVVPCTNALGAFTKDDVFRFTRAGTVITLTKNGVTIPTTGSFPATLFSTTTPVLVGARWADQTTNSRTTYFKDGMHYLDINGTKYIQQGDQNGNNILPSTPAGANGTIAGAGWKYVGISGHYETVALLNSYIASTTLTEPLEVVMLEPLDTSTVPTSKDGQPIILTRAFGGIVTDKLSFGFRFGF